MVNLTMKTTVEIRAKAENSTHSASEVQLRDLVQVIDEPTERGITLSEEIEVPFESIDLRVISNGTASYEQLQAVKAEVAKFCPVAKLFKNTGPRINESWETA